MHKLTTKLLITTLLPPHPAHALTPSASPTLLRRRKAGMSGAWAWGVAAGAGGRHTSTSPPTASTSAPPTTWSPVLVWSQSQAWSSPCLCSVSSAANTSSVSSLMAGRGAGRNCRMHGTHSWLWFILDEKNVFKTVIRMVLHSKH